MTSGIYKISNTLDGRVYIGASINIENRLITHKNYLRKGKHQNKLLQQAFDRESEYFSFEILEEIKNKETIKEREKYFIDFFESSNPDFGYNQTSYSGYSPERKSSSEAREIYEEFFADKFRELREQLSDKGFEVMQLKEKIRSERESKSYWKNKHQAMLMDINRNPYLKKSINKFEKEEHKKAAKVFDSLFN